MQETWRVNPNKEGVDYDDCPNPNCGQRDVEPYYRVGDRMRLYCCPSCHTSWSRSPRAQVEQDARAGTRTKFPTRDVAVERFISEPSPAYRDRYDLIDWSK